MGYTKGSSIAASDDCRTTWAGRGAAEAILRLRSQVIELQSQIRQMEAELAASRLRVSKCAWPFPGSLLRGHLD
jgi:hypothetical protein